MKISFKNFIYLMGLISLIALLAFVGRSGILEPQSSRDCQLYIDGVYQNPEIKQILTEKLGVHSNNIQGLELKVVDEIKRESPDHTIDAGGTYYDGTFDDCSAKEPPAITVLSSVDERNKTRIVAHEYIHHHYSRPWYKYVVSNIEQPLIMLYSSNQDMQDKLKDYLNWSGVRLTEVLAFACTEFPDNKLDPSIVSACNDMIPNRQVLGLN